MNTYSARDDNDLRPLAESLALTSSNTTLFSRTRTSDAAGNVISVNAVLPGGTIDNQAFCYHERNRLPWAGRVDRATALPAVRASSTTAKATASRIHTEFFWGSCRMALSESASLQVAADPVSNYRDGFGTITC